MPVKVSSQQTPARGQPDKMRARATSQSKNEDSASGGMLFIMGDHSRRVPAAGLMDSGDTEAPTRRRLQKPPSNNPPPDSASRHSRGVSASRIGAMGKRRLSIRDQKGPQGPRPQEAPRRYLIPYFGRFTLVFIFNLTRFVYRIPSTTFLHSGKSSLDSTNDSHQTSNSRTSDRSTTLPDLSKAEINRASPDGNDFLVPINFDDFHNSIVGEPSLNHFPMPGNQHRESANLPTNPWSNTKDENGGRLRNRPVRRKSEVPQPVGQNPPTDATSLPSTAARSRRQSLVQNPSANNTTNSRAPRKSIGPGSFPSHLSARRQSFTSRKASADAPSTESTSSRLRPQTQNFEATPRDEGRMPNGARNLKAKSMQPPSRGPGDADHSRSSSTNAARTPVKNSSGTATPSSSSKRISVVPPHATGLGARTISPTDARRMERMSTVPPAPPMPYSPPIQADLTPSRPHSSIQSPSLIPRKSATPSSSRTTPDPNRKSYSSGLSISSNTSYNSARNSGNSLQRLSQNLSSSRLPTPKPRTDHVVVGSDEEVPPVPAIPKAYDSPKGEMDHSMLPIPRKSSLPLDIGLHKSSHDPALENPVEDTADFLNERATKTPEAKSKASNGAGRRDLQSLKLPPLNLLPLGAPISTKIEALKERENEEVKPHTPSSQLMPASPSTPLTASRANFSVAREDDGRTSFTQPRSSTSHFVLSSAGNRAPSSSSGLAPFDGPSNGTRTASPYSSNTLPAKGSGGFNFLRQKASGDYTARETQSYKLTGPRPQTQTSPSSGAERLSQLSTPSDLDPGASYRSKVTVHRTRPESKVRQNAESDAERVKYDNMPPPKLPASATWNGLSSVKSSSPSLKPAYFKARRQSSVSSSTRNPSASDDRGLALEPTPSNESGESDQSQSRPAGSLLSPVHKIITTAKSNAAANPPPERPSDPDAAAADEEMRRLGSRRKDFESAAKSLDDLRSRAGPKERVSPAQALKMANLNIFERGEIIDFKDIYFCGTQNAKKHVGDLSAQSANFGYDDDRGDYNIVIGDHLAYRYEIIDVLGKGSFGQVVRCIDHKTGALVAVKIIRNKKRFHQQALTEVNLLQKLKHWDPLRRHSVVNFTQSFYFRGHLCMSTELLGMNLYEFIKAHDFKGFSLKLIRRFTKQMLGTLVLLHTKKVIHCDLKPENVLLVHPMSSEVRTIDFGSSCFENEKVYTYIQSRFYRSPEVILGMSYGMPIDMWSLGCILAELYTGYPLFPGENEQEQLACIMEVFGPPEKHLIEKSSRRKLFFDSLGKPRLTVSSKGRRRRPSSKDLRQVLKCEDEAFLDFLCRCLRWDPARRLNPSDALRHEFITGVKVSTRPRRYAGATNSPAKRVNSASTPSTRPLPEPPSTSLKSGSFVRSRDVSGSSPVKPVTAGKRNSTVSGAAPSTPAKRTTSNTTSGSGSALPRVSARSISGKSDLATAAAATSLVGCHPASIEQD